jgi:acid phosphatase class B
MVIKVMKMKEKKGEIIVLIHRRSPKTLERASRMLERKFNDWAMFTIATIASTEGFLFVQDTVSTPLSA